MTLKKTLRQRELELQALHATEEGRIGLQKLESEYAKVQGACRVPNTSVITFILVHERQRGLIST
ncbi:hypothetical protein BH10PLA2_BH10PLA2_39920 [soil metagenome]